MIRIVALLLLALPATLRAQHELTPLPWIDDGGGCPFECCRLGPWTSDTGFVAFQEERNPAGGSFEVPAQAVITAMQSKVYTTSLGIAVMQRRADIGRNVMAFERPPLVLEAGQTIILLGDHAEAPPYVLIDGRQYDVTQFWWDPADGPYTVETSEHSPALLIQPLEREWWVRFEYEGRTGWIDAFTVPMQGQDACE